MRQLTETDVRRIVRDELVKQEKRKREKAEAKARADREWDEQFWDEVGEWGSSS